jgi:hypothetical protein
MKNVFVLNGQCHEMDIFLGLNILISTFHVLYVLMVFEVFQ